MKKLLINLLGYQLLFVLTIGMMWFVDVVNMKEVIHNYKFWLAWMLCTLVVYVINYFNVEE